MGMAMDGLGWLDAELKTWARWVIRQRDGGIGWAKRSPLTNFGSVGSSGYGTNYNVWDASAHEMHVLDERVRSLPGPDVRVLMLYYVQAGCVARRCGEMMGGKHPTQVKRDLVRVLRALEMVLAKREEV